jgi:SAM-dependent methyltransferase
MTTTTKTDKIKRVEGETLKTFREEIPSQYFSHKTEAEYRAYVKNAEYMYRDLFKFPPQMFRGADLIDFGAGTGENTVYLSNWGARCTLVEMNPDAQKISREVFQRYAREPQAHQFVLSSIFDYEPEPRGEYDIVHCRGVLSHTAANARAFAKIASFAKPGGFVIFGDPNKAGGLQNMLQRYAVYKFASTPDEMCDVSELLFKEDIDRSERFIPRTRRAIIFDRWVIQSQDDPSVPQVLQWMRKAGLRLYSAYPPVLMPLQGDSAHHRPKFDPASLPALAAVTELIWMLQTESDAATMPRFAKGLAPVAGALSDLADYMANFNKRTKLDAKRFHSLSRALAVSSKKLDFLAPLRDKLAVFLKEADEFVALVDKSELKQVRKYIERTKVLFKGACGVRHVDFVAHKPAD